ncbi:MAG: ATP-binding cassette domain-containing protein [Acidimicrobiales bacterium]
MIECRELSKRYGSTVAVDHLSFDVLPGRVTGFLGPNGAGKSTTLRMIMGLDSPTSGTARVLGQPYHDHRRPLFKVGGLLDAQAIHGGRSARKHLLCLAQSNGIGRRRVDEVLETVGLGDVAKKRVGGFSLGMGQRLGIAAALLGDPEVLLFDEPVNGLDPEGILWIRTLMRSLAGEGRTVFVSSHLMSEMALTAEHLIVIGRGRLIADASVADFVDTSSARYVRVRSPRIEVLVALLKANGATTTTHDSSAVDVKGLDSAAIGDLAAAQGIALHELAPQQASLEEAFMELTRDSVDFHAEGSRAQSQVDQAAHP